MNRREVLRFMAGATAIAGAGTTAQAYDADTDVALIVITAPGYIRPETAERLQAYAEAAMANTPFSKAKWVVMGDGLKVEMYRANGERVNPVTPLAVVP